MSLYSLFVSPDNPLICIFITIQYPHSYETSKMPCINPCKICNTNKFVTQMDFYLATFSHVLAVNAKYCLNSNETVSYPRPTRKKVVISATGYAIIKAICKTKFVLLVERNLHGNLF